VSLVVLVFAGLGAAVFALMFLLAPRRPGLLAAVGRLDAARHRAAPEPTVVATPRGFLQTGQLRLGQRLARALAARGIALPFRRADLELLHRSYEMFLGGKVLTGLYGLCLLPAAGLALAPAGVRLPTELLAVGGLLLGVGFFFLPDLGLRRQAERARRDFRRALGCYLDLVAMSLAGGRGAPQALPEAASIADGWAYRLIGDTLATARLAGHTPWQALGELGERVGVQELRDLAGSLTLVGDHGAKIRDSLAARASTLRRRQLADAEGQAGEADQSMRLAQLLLAIGFLILISYPAVANVLAF
jgi:tight adherence protein C